MLLHCEGVRGRVRVRVRVGVGVGVGGRVRVRVMVRVRDRVRVRVRVRVGSCSRLGSFCSKQPRSSVVSVAVERTASLSRRALKRARRRTRDVLPQPLSPVRMHSHCMRTQLISACSGRSCTWSTCSS